MFNQWSLYNDSYIMKKRIFVDFFQLELRQKYKQNHVTLSYLTCHECNLKNDCSHLSFLQ